MSSIAPEKTDTDASLWEAVDRYVEGYVTPSDEALGAAQEESRAAGLPAISVSAVQGKLLMLLAQSVGARRILEIGTLGGYSTIWLARALTRAGRLITVEANPAHAEVARRNLEHAGVAGSVEVRVGLALDVLPRVAAEGGEPFDLVFIDADKANTPAYFEWAIRLSRPGSLIIVDNVVRNGRLLDAETDDPDVRGMRELVQHLGADQRVSATVIQTVGVKGHDGLAIARVV